MDEKTSGASTDAAEQREVLSGDELTKLANRFLDGLAEMADARSKAETRCAELLAQLAAAKADAARAELRERELREVLEACHEEQSDRIRKCGLGDRPSSPRSSLLKLNTLVLSALESDSDARLREVVNGELLKFAQWLAKNGLALHPEESVDAYRGVDALEHTGINKVLGVKP